MKYLLISILAIQLLSCHFSKSPNTFDSLDTGINAAKEKNVKIFVAFDVFGSPTNYVDEIIQDKKVASALNNNVIVRLRCDDRSKINDTMSVGELNSKLQRELTGEYFQPMFCFLDKTGRRISPLLGYSKKEDVIEYILKYVQ